MRKNAIIHVPHASLNLPHIFYDKLLLDKDYIDRENIYISDYLVDKFIPEHYENVIRFNYSRLFCDVERFKEDKLEKMAKIGMGCIYEKDSNGNSFITVNDQYRNTVISNYYDKHHQLLRDLTEKMIKLYDRCYIVDLHSFSDDFVFKIFGVDNCPDICIGYQKEFRNEELLKLTIYHFKKYHYKVGINYPYKGSMVPDKYYHTKDSRVNSIMIELNKRIYLDKNEKLNASKYNRLKECMDEYFKSVNDFISKKERRRLDGWD